jgi:hypothetical protein
MEWNFNAAEMEIRHMDIDIFTHNHSLEHG